MHPLIPALFNNPTSRASSALASFRCYSLDNGQMTKYHASQLLCCTHAQSPTLPSVRSCPSSPCGLCCMHCCTSPPCRLLLLHLLQLHFLLLPPLYHLMLPKLRRQHQCCSHRHHPGAAPIFPFIPNASYRPRPKLPSSPASSCPLHPSHSATCRRSPTFLRLLV